MRNFQAFYIHFITEDDRVYAKERRNFVPDIGHEVRFGDKYFEVCQVVWCMDEPESEEAGLQRVNIGLTEIQNG